MQWCRTSRAQLAADLAAAQQAFVAERRRASALELRLAETAATAESARLVAAARDLAREIVAEAAAHVRFSVLHVRGLLVDLPIDHTQRLDEVEFAARVFDAAVQIRKSEESHR